MRTARDCATFGGEAACGPIYYRIVRLCSNGEPMDGHSHNFDHATLVVKGRYKMTIRGSNAGPVEEERIVGPGDWINIAATRHHNFELMRRWYRPSEVGLLYCIYTHRTPDGSVLQTRGGDRLSDLASYA